ncbi:MAG: hypothetical protein P8X73_10950 [Ignavibacteriaceae bacterium]|jgi:hypothetical protein
MTEIIDYIGSVIVVGIVILIVTNIHFSLNQAAVDSIYSTNLEYNIVGLAQRVEFDLYKVGYRVEGDKILVADSSRIEFLTDINDDGKIDSVLYSVGDVSELDSTENPNDRILYRTLNNSTSMLDNITRLNISYYDSSFNKINYADLSDPYLRSAIKGIQLQLIKETADTVNNGYKKIEWKKVIKPINLL